MVAFRQYPDTLVIPGTPVESQKDENGIWQTQTGTASSEWPCRYEPAAITKRVEVADGLVIEYKGVIYTPQNTPRIANGVTVNVTDVIEEEVKYFFKGQLHCMIYI